MTAKWKIKLAPLIEEGEEANEELGGNTKIILEQRLQIATGGQDFPATWKSIHENDKLLKKKFAKADASKANFQQQLNGINQEMNRIRDSALSPQKKHSHLTRLGNQRNTILNRLNIADIDFRKYKRFLEGATQFGNNVLTPLKGNGINYRVYLQRKGDEKQIDVMRSFEEGLARTHLEDALFAHMILRYKSESLGDCYK